MARRAQGHEDKIKEIRELAEKDLRVFAKLVNPLRVYGEIHLNVFSWWMISSRDWSAKCKKITFPI